VLFHHEPDHSDAVIDEMVERARAARRGGDTDAAFEGMTIDLSAGTAHDPEQPPR